jgi:hypothetical protein
MAGSLTEVRATLAERVGQARALQDAGLTSPYKPPHWPDAIRCALCKNWHPTLDYLILQRQKALASLCNRVVVCPDPACGHIFSPSPEYLRLYGRSDPNPVPSPEKADLC